MAELRVKLMSLDSEPVPQTTIYRMKVISFGFETRKSRGGHYNKQTEGLTSKHCKQDITKYIFVLVLLQILRHFTIN